MIDDDNIEYSEYDEDDFFDDESESDEDIFGPLEVDEYAGTDQELGNYFDGGVRPLGTFDSGTVRHPRGSHIWKGEGLRVELRRIPGVTRKGILRRPLRFQCPPLETFRVDNAVTANDYSTIENGVYTQIGDRELTTVSFQTLTTIAPEAFVVHGGSYNPKKTSRRLRNILQSKTAFKIVAWHGGKRRAVELNMMATLRSLGIEERAGEGDARYYDIEFVQWRDPVVRRRRRKNQHKPKYVRLKKKDTLASLAQRHLGGVGMEHYIRSANPQLKKWGRNTPIVKNKYYEVWTPKLKDKRKGLIRIPNTPSGGVRP